MNVMKPILVLILGCMPLAVLTIAASLGLDEPARTIPRPAAASRLADVDLKPLEQQATAMRPLIAGLLQADLFHAQPIPALQNMSRESRLAGLANHWVEWMQASQLIADAMAADGRGSDRNSTDLEQTAERLEGLAKRVGSPSTSGSQVLLAAVAKRGAEIRQQLDQEKTRAEGRTLLQNAQRELAEGRHAQSLAICQRLLSAPLKDTLDEVTAEQVCLLRRRAEFARDVQRTAAVLRTASEESRQLDAFRALVETYGEANGLTAAESATLEKYRGQFQSLERRQNSERQSRLARQAVEAMERDLPADFASRVSGVARIVADYPEAQIKTRLANDVRRWMAEFLPEKTLSEPADLREAETTDGEIVRGYFQRVNDREGHLTGYQRYPTLEQLRRPVSAVGTFPKSGFKSEPQPSLPRRCVERYREARARLLASPHDARQWTDLAELCKELDRSLAEYRKKPGASEERLSFSAEASFAAAAGSETLSRLKTLLPPY
jgi:hypothetical protein